MSNVAVRSLVTRVLRSDRPTDADLLAWFAARRDADAFAELVARHGGMVLGTARRLLRDSDTANDVYQATFLVLARKAGSGEWGTTVGPWLHETAVRLSRVAARRLRLPPSGTDSATGSQMPDPAAAAERGEVYRLLDLELAGLPAELRGPIVLCYLQGRTRDEAADALGCSLAMLKRRLARGRALLRDRLTRRGITLPAAAVGILWADLLSACPVAARATARAVIEHVTTGRTPVGAAALIGAGGGRGWWRAMVAMVGLVACGLGLAQIPGGTSPQPRRDPVTKTESPAVLRGALPAGALTRLGTTRLRPGGAIRRLAVSPDGTKVASWSSDSLVTDALVIWDARTGEQLRRVDLPGARLDALAWLPDGRGIAIVRSDYQDADPFVWEFTDDKAMPPPLKPRQHGGIAVAAPLPDNEHDSCFAISPDGKALAVGRAGNHVGDRAVRVHPIKTGVRVSALPDSRKLGTHPGNCGLLRFTPDGKSLVVLGSPKYVGDASRYDGKYADEVVATVLDVAAGKERRRLTVWRAAQNGDHAVAVAVSNQALAIGRDNGEIKLWDLATGKAVRVIQDGPDPTLIAAFSADGKSLTTAGRSGIPKMWDVESGELRKSLGRHYSWIEALAISPDGKVIATGGQDSLIRIWDAATGADKCPQPGHKYTVSGAVLSPDGKTAVTAGWDSTLRWWTTDTGIEVRVVDVANGLDGLALSPDGKTVLAASAGKLRTWELASGRETTPATQPAGVNFGQLSFTPDGRHLLSMNRPKIAVCEWPEFKLVRTLTMPKFTHSVLTDVPKDSEIHCTSATISPDGKWLVTVAYRHMERRENGLTLAAGADGAVHLWEFATGKEMCELVESPGGLQSAAFTPDGRLVLVGAGGSIHRDGTKGESFAGELNLLDPVAGRHVRQFEVPAAAATVQSRRASASLLAPDGRTLYVAYTTGEIIGYEIATGRPRRTLVGHQGFIAALAASADGRRLLSGSGDGSATVWDLTPAGFAEPSRTGADPDQLWQAATGQLAPADSFAAMAALATMPDRAVEVARRHVKPVAKAPPANELDQLFADLDSKAFTTREKAARALTGYGEALVPAVRNRLAAGTSAEVRERLNAFLAQFDSPIPSAERIRLIRAVELLESIASPTAKKLLEELAGGASGDPLTLDAAAALRRLNAQHK